MKKESIPDALLGSFREYLQTHKQPDFSIICRTARETYLKDENHKPYCYLPIGFWTYYAVEVLRLTTEEAAQFALLGTILSGWVGGGRGIYRFDPDLLPILLDSETDSFPKEVLLRLPEYSCFVPCTEACFPISLQTSLEGLQGVFIHIDDDYKYNDAELRFTLYFPKGEENEKFLRYYLPLQHDSLEACLQDMVDIMTKEIWANEMFQQKYTCEEVKESVLSSEAIPHIRCLFSMALALCCQNIEITPANPAAKNTVEKNPLTPQNEKIIMETETHKWDVGIRIGSAIRLGQKEQRTRSAEMNPLGSSRQPVRPHMRKAHYHHYWIGPRSNKERERIVHWIPPTPVAIPKDGHEDMPTVIHPVKRK